MKSVFEQRAFGATIQISGVTTWEVLLEMFIKSRELCATASKRLFLMCFVMMLQYKKGDATT